MLKKIYALLVCTLFVGSAFSQPAFFSVTSSQQEQFRLFINGVEQHFSPVESISVSGLSANVYFTIRVELNNRERTSVTARLRMHPGDNNYMVAFRPHSKRLTLMPLNDAFHPSITVPLRLLGGPAPQPNGGAQPPHPDNGHPQPNGGTQPSHPDNGQPQPNGGTQPSHPDNGQPQPNGGTQPSHPDNGQSQPNGGTQPSHPDNGQPQPNGGKSSPSYHGHRS